MDELNLRSHVLMAIYLCVQCIKGAPLTDKNGTKPSKLNGKILRELGLKLRQWLAVSYKTNCKFNSTNSKQEAEFGICDGLCPKSYNTTKHGFFLKLYNDKKRTKEKAELQCTEEGGHLINIDSEIKYEDVGNLMRGFKSSVWIDGHRKSVTSPWMYTYGSQRGFIKWYPVQPTDTASELCVNVHPYSSILWSDKNCDNHFFSICEI